MCFPKLHSSLEHLNCYKYASDYVIVSLSLLCLAANERDRTAKRESRLLHYLKCAVIMLIGVFLFFAVVLISFSSLFLNEKKAGPLLIIPVMHLLLHDETRGGRSEIIFPC